MKHEVQNHPVFRHAPLHQQRKERNQYRTNPNIGTQLKVRCIDDRLDPKIDLKDNHVNPIEEFSVGPVFKSINVGVNKMISNMQSLIITKPVYPAVKNNDLIKSSQVPGPVKLPSPAAVRLNMHNINEGYEALLQTN